MTKIKRPMSSSDRNRVSPIISPSTFALIYLFFFLLLILLRLCFKTTKNNKRRIRAKRTRGSFDAAVKTSSTTTIHDGEGGGPSDLSSWVRTRLLGEGAYGSVYLATSKNPKNKQERAIKTAQLSRASSLMDEGRILHRLDSPFIVRCYGEEVAHQEADNSMQYSLILEYCSGRTLADLIVDNPGGLSEFDVKFFTRDVLSGLRYIHDRNIIHCDIKPDNLFLSSTDHRFRPNGYLTKLGDFGLAMEKGSMEYGNGSGHQRGTKWYMAPELMNDGILDYGVDSWSLGCTVLEMLTGQNVWGEYGELGLEDWVDLIGYSDCIPCIPTWLSEEAKDFLSKCLERDADMRWSSHSLTNHPFCDI